MKRYAGGAINELLPMPLRLLVQPALSENQLIEQDVLLAPYQILLSVQNATQPEKPQHSRNSDWVYLIYMPPRGFEPRS